MKNSLKDLKEESMQKKSKQIIFGLILIVVSIAVIFFNLKNFKGSFNKLWPSILLLVGLIFYVLYFSTKKKKDRKFLLFLATFLAVSSVPLFVLTYTSFSYINVVWPGFLLSIGVALISVYFFSNKKRITLVLSILLIAISLLVWIFYTIKSPFGLVIGVSLLLIGAAFLTRGLIKETEKEGIVQGSETEEE